MTPNTVVVHPSLPVKTVKDLIALAKARPGVFKEPLIKSHADGVVAERGGCETSDAGRSPDYEAKERGEADAALCRNPHGTVLCGRSALSLGLTRDPAIGRASLRASHPAKDRRHREGLDQRFLNYSSAGNGSSSHLAAELPTAAAKEELLNRGVEALAHTTPEQLAAMMKSEIARLGKVIKAAGIVAH